MQLTYRGINYSQTHTQVKMVETGLKATYRGAAYALKKTFSLPLKPKFDLTYRGIPYVRRSEEAASVKIFGNITLKT